MAGFLSLQWNNHSLAFLNLLNSLHSKELYCDATIACHGKFYPVHRMVLSTCSEYFQEIFNLTQCKHPFIIINDARPSELEALLEYMYKGNINVPQNELPNLLKAAEALRIKGLAVPDKLSPDKEVSKKRSSSQNSSSKKLKVTHKEKSSDDSKRDSHYESGRESPALVILEDKDSIIEEKTLIKEEPVVNDRLDQEPPSSIEEPSIKSEPYDPLYSDAQINQDDLPYPTNLDWPVDTGGSDRVTQHSICGLQEMLETFPGRMAEVPSLGPLLAPSSTRRITENSQARLKCPYCPFWAMEHQTRAKHLSMKHPEYLPFGCSICSYKCLSRATLLIHVRKHTGERPFTCHYTSCNYKSTTNSNLRRHMKIIHSLRPRSTV